MNSKAKVYVEAILREVEHWPGVEVEIAEGAKHPKAKFTYEGRTLFRPFSGTSTVAVSRMLGEMRRTMRELGAERASPDPKAEDDDREYHKPNEGAKLRASPVAAEPVERKADIVEQLGDLGLAPKEADEAERAGGVLSDRVAKHLASHRPDIDLAWRVKIDATVPRSGWGFYTDIPAEDYHLDPCPEPSISNSLMPAMLEKTPRDFAWAHPRRNELDPAMPIDPEVRESTLAKIRGDVVHQIALGKGRGFAIGDFERWQSNDAKAFKKAAEDDGLTPIKRKDYEEALPLAERIKERIARALDGADYQTEVVFMYQEQTAHGPVWVRGMIDVWCPERLIILDPKVTARLYDGTIERHALAMGWDRQSALYTHAIAQIMPEAAGRVEFWDLMINPDAPYVSRLWAPERAWEASSVRQCQIAIERFGECLWSKKWPGFGKKPTRGPMPAWEDKRRTEMELGA